MAISGFFPFPFFMVFTNKGTKMMDAMNRIFLAVISPPHFDPVNPAFNECFLKNLYLKNSKFYTNRKILKSLDYD